MNQELAFEHMGIKVYMVRSNKVTGDGFPWYQYQTEWMETLKGSERLRSHWKSGLAEARADEAEFKKRLELFVTHESARKI